MNIVSTNDNHCTMNVDIKLQHVSFSDDAQSVINRPVKVHCPISAVDGSSAKSLAHYYDLDRLINLINQHSFQRIGLQFSDELLAYAGVIAKTIEHQTHSKCFVLADTTFGTCCVDEVAAEHVDAQIIIHFGHSCLSSTTKLPVIFSFGLLEISLDRAVQTIKSKVPTDRPLVLLADLRLWHVLENLRDILSAKNELNDSYPSVIISNTSFELNSIVWPEQRKSQNDDCFEILPNRYIDIPQSPTETRGVKTLESYNLVYIGPPSNTLTTLLMTKTRHFHGIYNYQPLMDTCEIELISTNALLRRRYVAALKARDAGTIGIVIGTLSVTHYLDIISQLRQRILQSGKKVYMFAMGKLNPAKMANFDAIDCFVLIACGESGLVQSRDYYRPIVTPYELTLALQSGSTDSLAWSNTWITDFQIVLQMMKYLDNEPEQPKHDDDIPHFSLVSSRLISTSKPLRSNDLRSLSSTNDSSPSQVLDLKQRDLMRIGGVLSTAAQRLHEDRSWRGLDYESMEKSAQLEEGLSGIPKSYHKEQK